MTEKFQGYGFQKCWHWSMRSDLPTAVQVVTPGDIYFSPFTMDTPCRFYGASGLKGKWSLEVLVFGLSTWSVNWYQGVYKRMRGATGSATTFKLIGWTVSNWSGTANFGPTIIYDASTATSVTTGTIEHITDGQLYYANLWTTSLVGIGAISILKYGNSVTSGSWCYHKSGLTGQSSLPQTIAAESGFAKVDVEHWIGEY